jgi:hypothetical protein
MLNTSQSYCTIDKYGDTYLYNKMLKDFIGDYKLSKKIELGVSYNKENENWCLSNVEIGINGCGENLKLAEESFNKNFEGLIASYLIFSDEELSDKSKINRGHLSKYINFEDFTPDEFVEDTHTKRDEES